MRLHRNARTCPATRRLIADRVIGERWSREAAAAAVGTSERTVAKWLGRFCDEGVLGLEDRSSAPHRIPHKTPADRVEAIRTLRRLRFTGAEISSVLGMPVSTVHAVLKRIGLGRLSRLESTLPANRYQRQRPGELLHIDIKKLARIDGVGHAVTGTRRGQKRRKGARRIGSEYVHVCVDDATRLAYVEVLPDQRATTAIGFLRRAIGFFAARGVVVERGHDRQRLRLHLSGLGAHLPCAWRPPHPHPATTTTDQRQGRAIHPHPGRRLGTRRHLRDQRRPQPSTPSMARLLQSPPTTRQPRSPATRTPATSPPGRTTYLGSTTRRPYSGRRRGESPRLLQARPTRAGLGHGHRPSWCTDRPSRTKPPGRRYPRPRGGSDGSGVARSAHPRTTPTYLTGPQRDSWFREIVPCSTLTSGPMPGGRRWWNFPDPPSVVAVCGRACSTQRVKLPTSVQDHESIRMDARIVSK
jgi:transposase